MWKIDHAEHRDNGTVSVCRLAFMDTDEQGKPRKRTYQLQTAIRIPPPGPAQDAAIAVLIQAAKDFRKPADPHDLSAIEAKLNAGDK